MQDVRDRVAAEVRKVVVGHDDAVELLVMAVVIGGHVLIEGMPGVAKTLLAKSVARALAVDFTRVQFSPDLTPQDLAGRHADGELGRQFRPGPLFTNILLADEINRTPPKTQAALLEAMEEGQVTVEGKGMALPDPFCVVATKNPIEYEGTHPLPEAQVDRFLFKVSLDYPTPEQELAIVGLTEGTTGLHPATKLMPVLGRGEVLDIRSRVATIRLEESAARFAVTLVRHTRSAPEVLYGASPRAAVHLVAASRAAAFLSGRAAASVEDVAAMARPVLSHRIVLRPEAEIEGIRPNDVVTTTLSSLSATA